MRALWEAQEHIYGKFRSGHRKSLKEISGRGRWQSMKCVRWGRKLLAVMSDGDKERQVQAESVAKLHMIAKKWVEPGKGDKYRLQHELKNISVRSVYFEWKLKCQKNYMIFS